MGLKTATGALMIVAGAIWVLQGFDVAFAPHSFMTGNLQWVLWGGLALVAGCGLVLWDRRSG